jgi:hypothetical protein
MILRTNHFRLMKIFGTIKIVGLSRPRHASTGTKVLPPLAVGTGGRVGPILAMNEDVNQSQEFFDELSCAFYAWASYGF